MTASAIGEQFQRVCRDRADLVAVRQLAPRRTTTFADLSAWSVVIRRALHDLGVEPGTAVVSVVGNRPIFFSVVVACVEAGTALLPLGEATDAEVLGLIEQAGASAVIMDRELPLETEQVQALDSDMRMYRVKKTVHRRRYRHSVVLKLTSGSTQLPKAAIASEQHLINDGRHIVEAMGITALDVNFTCIPLSHSYAFGNVVMPLLWQGTSVTLKHSFSPAQFMNDVAESRSTIFPGVPFMFERIKSLEGLDRLPEALRLLITAGARIDPRTVSWFRDRLDRKVHSFYGSSETGGITYDDSDDVADPIDVGHPMPETSVSVRQPDEGGAGRIFVAGNAVALGYAETPEGDNASSFGENGFLTGDLGYLDDAGRLVLTGRVSTLVNVSGRKVDPAEVERTLLDVPGITEARVFGMSCGTRGQEVVAFLVRTDASLTPIAIRQTCAAILSAHKIPRRFVFIDRFPVDARGKLDRQALQQLASVASDE